MNPKFNLMDVFLLFKKILDEVVKQVVIKQDNKNSRFSVKQLDRAKFSSFLLPHFTCGWGGFGASVYRMT